MKTFTIQTLVFISIILLLQEKTHAQLKWQEAKLRLVTGEKMNVEVREFISARVPQKIKYREGKGSKTKICNPRDIALLEFRWGRKFMRAKTEIDLTPIDMNKLKDFFDHDQVDTTILVTELVRGKYSLYYFLDINGKNHFFISGRDIPFHELRYRLGWVNENGELYIRKDFEFRDELMMYRDRCRREFRKPFNLEYRKRELVDFVKSLNKCG